MTKEEWVEVVSPLLDAYPATSPERAKNAVMSWYDALGVSRWDHVDLAREVVRDIVRTHSYFPSAATLYAMYWERVRRAGGGDV